MIKIRVSRGTKFLIRLIVPRPADAFFDNVVNVGVP